MKQAPATKYHPASIEEKWRRRWQEQQTFAHDRAQQEDHPAYCIVLPPPNVTGTLHMGHAFQTTLIDALIRRQRMRRCATLWQGGVDHAGIATQMVVERLLAQEGSSRADLGRDKFIDRIWQWKEQSGNTINQQLRRMGCSLDWSRERFTMDPSLSQAVTEAFCQLYHAGLIYRGQKLTNWDPELQTVLSDLEVVYQEEAGQLYYIRYPVLDSSHQLIVATTRPETLFGDSAVAVHPDDPRHKAIVGGRAVVPLTDRQVPIITDQAVDPEFGTGCLKITPAHDFNDFEVGQRHDLPALNIMDQRARLNDNVPATFRGIDRFEARKKIVAALEQNQLLVKVEQHQQRIPRGDRSHAVLEPRLTHQWFVNLTTEQNSDGTPGGLSALVRPAIDAVKQGEIKFIPQQWENTYFSWMNNLHDWCISRQIWWGHRIPAWYDEQGQVYVGTDEQTVRKNHQLDADQSLTQDEDVLDTWFSSALWPFSSLDWPLSNNLVDRFYPTSVLVTGFDIIFFWVARMIMFGLYFQKQVPFREVYIHGLIRDTHNQKMSKSRGNIIDPIDLIDGIDLDALVTKRTANMMQPQLKQRVEKQTRREFPQGISAYGCDSLRFAFCSLASTGRDIQLDMKRVESSRNFCNKLWNAARYLTMLSDNHPAVAQAREAVNQTIGQGRQPALKFAHPHNRWIVSELCQTVAQVDRHFESYRFDLLAKNIYEFTWESYCNWFVEINKCLINDPNTDQSTREESLLCLYSVFAILLRLIHPLTPFISEEIHLQLFDRCPDGLSTLAWPELPRELIDQPSCTLLSAIRGTVSTIRQARSSRGVSPKQRLSAWLHHPQSDSLNPLLDQRRLICGLAGLDQIELFEADAQSAVTSLHFFADTQILLQLDGDDALTREQRRLEDEHARTDRQLSSLNLRLADRQYLNKAPEHLVEQNRSHQLLLKNQLKEIEQQLDHVQNLSSGA